MCGLDQLTLGIIMPSQTAAPAFGFANREHLCGHVYNLLLHRPVTSGVPWCVSRRV